MKLNHDCVRDLLLYIEENQSLSSRFFIITDDKDLNGKLNYDHETIVYTASILNQEGYINARAIGAFDYSFSEYSMSGLNAEGHRFLDTIRDDKVWEDTKLKISSLASVSLPIVQQIASSFILKTLGL